MSPDTPGVSVPDDGLSFFKWRGAVRKRMGSEWPDDPRFEALLGDCWDVAKKQGIREGFSLGSDWIEWPEKLDVLSDLLRGMRVDREVEAERTRPSHYWQTPGKGV